MSGSSIGERFRVTTFGESHGPALGCIVEGCPPGLPLDEACLQGDVERRRTGKSRHTSQRKEADQVKILSGVFEGLTTGTPIGLMVENQDQKPKDYRKIADRFRPGHADYSYHHKFGHRDYRGGGRSSARETVMRVAAGAIARRYLEQNLGTNARAYLAQLGEIPLGFRDWASVEENPFFCADPARLEELESYMHQLRKSGDSVGARINLVVAGVPVGLGEPVFDRLDADLAKAMMSINAVKGVEVGDGFACVHQKGTEHRDEISPEGFLSNHAGGVLGGISTGQKLRVSVALKPTSSLRLPGKSVNVAGEPVEVVTTGRHDPCVGLRAVPIVEAMALIVIMDHYLRHRAQNAEVEAEGPIIPGAPGE